VHGRIREIDIVGDPVKVRAVLRSVAPEGNAGGRMPG
jgi:hypothetical protein